MALLNDAERKGSITVLFVKRKGVGSLAVRYLVQPQPLPELAEQARPDSLHVLYVVELRSERVVSRGAVSAASSNHEMWLVERSSEHRYGRPSKVRFSKTFR